MRASSRRLFRAALPNGWLAILLVGCAAAAPQATSPAPEMLDDLQRALVEPSQVAKAVEVEKGLAVSSDVLPTEGEPWFEVRSDTGAILVSGPHATTHTREGRPKDADGGSGSLAVALAGMTGASLIYTTRRSPTDPNYDDDNDYKRALRAMLDSLKPVVVLDIHTSHWRRPYDVDLGTMGGRSLLGRQDLLQVLVRALRAEGIANISLDFFPAVKNRTVTRWATNAGVPAIQLEINAVWLLHERADAAQEHRFAQVLQALTRFARRVKR